jgi:hypothetical protein
MTDDLDLDIATDTTGSDDDLLAEDKDLDVGDVDPLDVPLDEEELVDDESIDPEKEEGEDEGLFGFGLPGELNDDGEFVSPAIDDEEEEEELVDENLFN